MSEHAANAVAAAWFVDPTNAQQWRWWDGSTWTEHVAPLHGSPAVDATAVAVADEAPAVVEDPRRWPVPSPDTPLHRRTIDGAVPSLGGRIRWRVIARLPQLTMSLIGSIILAAFDAALSSQRSRFNPLDPTSISDDEYHAMRSEGPSPIVQAMRTIRDEARDEVWDLAFLARGLDGGEHRGSPTNWPLLRNTIPVLAAAADVYPRWIRRSELRGFPAWWGELASYDPAPGRDSLPRTHRHFAVFEIPPLAAERHVAASVGPRRKLPFRKGRHGFEQVELESIAVTSKLTVDVKAGSDPVAVRELFGPQLVARLADAPVHWDQRFEHLFVYRDSPVSDPIGSIDEFLESAVAVARAYWTDQD
ncbi:MAG: hypothetical protein JWL76_1688 [Thermoleophilia bacterium]|nr:hypothetical protein [Thermoleophilia bacterium]